MNTEKSLLPSYVVEQGIVNTCLARGADFEIYTGAMQVEEGNPEEKYLVSMTGSSTMKDMQNDRMALTAINDMIDVPSNLTLFLNHSYNVPEDVYGGLYQRPIAFASNAIVDLKLRAETDTTNPRALQTYHMIAVKKRRLGCSIGCLVTDCDYDEEDDCLVINHVVVLEWSIVGIPAQQRCWVEVATKSVFERYLMEGRGYEALMLAPAVRGMYWRAYDGLIKHVSSDGLRKDLERVTPRHTPSHRIMHVFNDGEINFALADTKGITKSLNREEVSSLLQPERQQDMRHKSVSGKTSWPLMDIETEWTGSTATKQIFDYARDDHEEIVASKAKQCFLYYNPNETDVQSGYKMPFCSIVDGSPKIVPLGVQACAGVLNGGMGGIHASDEDKNGMKAKVKTMYGRINSQFHPDPEWGVPWEKKDDKEASAAKDLADSSSDAPLNRQDRGEDDGTMTISDNGTHAPFTGTHSHAHKTYGDQGSDDMHEHEHTHDGNADHGHDHVEKSVDPGVQKRATENEETPVQTALDTPSVAVSEVAVIPPTDDPMRRSLLAIYNDIGKQLGFASMEMDATKCLAGADQQQVITLVSQLDSCLDAVMQSSSGIANASSLCDQLMDLLGIPDTDRMSSSSGYPMGLYDSLDVRIENALTNFFLVKDGREISGKNERNLEAVHSIIKSMHPGVCDGTTAVTVDEATDEARMQGEGQPLQPTPLLSASIAAIDNLTKALSAVSVKELARGAVDEALLEAKKSLDLIQREQRVLLENIRTLKEVPLGRPTTFAGRTAVQVSEESTTYNDLLRAGVRPQETSEEELEVVIVNGMRCKRWPAGFLVGQRPPLTEFQKMYMSPYDYLPYADGSREVLIPVIDEVRV